jgi:hypothetical protein
MCGPDRSHHGKLTLFELGRSITPQALFMASTAFALVMWPRRSSVRVWSSTSRRSRSCCRTSVMVLPSVSQVGPMPTRFVNYFRSFSPCRTCDTCDTSRGCRRVVGMSGPLKGRTVSVDARTTGYAFVLFDLLKRKGLNDADYKVEKAGGVLQRWDALKEKKHDGTLLLTPFDFIAKANGFNVLEYAIDVYGHYQGLVGASRRAWAADNPHKVQAFIKGYASGVDFLLDPKNKAEAIAILRKRLPQMSEQLADQSYSYMAGPKGFTPKAKIDMDGVRKVLELRSVYGEPNKALTVPTKYYDSKYYDAAHRN